jgi:hypothetical protein
MRKVKLTFIAMVFALVAAQDSVPVPISAYALAANPQSSYASDQAMLRGEFDQLRRSIDIANGSSIYNAYQLGRPLLRAAFAAGDAQLKRDIVKHSATLVRSLPTYGAVAEASKEDVFAEAVDRLSPKLREARVAVTGHGPKFDGIPLPYDRRLYNRRIFPLTGNGELQINTGNIQQFGYYLSTLLRLAARDSAMRADPEATRDLREIASYLANDYLRFFWQEAPAWHWSGAFFGGMRERSLARLDGLERLKTRRFFRGFLDYDMHVMAVAADLKAAARSEPKLLSGRGEMAVVDDVNKVAARVLSERATAGEKGADFSFDRGFWDDNPVAQYGGCQDARLPRRPCPLKDYTIDISHGQRWPAWLESFAAAAENDSERKRMASLRTSLAKRIAADIRHRDGRVLLTNFLDGRDGWFLTTESKDGHNANPPSSMTGWAMRYGALAELADVDPAITTAQTQFCRTIISASPQDIQFRMQYYGEPEANPANGVRPQTDEYGSASRYAHICRMVELAQRR